MPHRYSVERAIEFWAWTPSQVICWCSFLVATLFCYLDSGHGTFSSFIIVALYRALLWLTPLYLPARATARDIGLSNNRPGCSFGPVHTVLDFGFRSSLFLLVAFVGHYFCSGLCVELYSILVLCLRARAVQRNNFSQWPFFEEEIAIL